MKHIAVFGASNPRPGEPSYQSAMRLGEMLGEAGYTVMTGGYIGTMEAVSHGAAKAGAHVIGVTCVEIENFRPGGANPWVKEELRTETIRERIHTMMSTCDAALALPGGIGTLAEVVLMWNHLLIRAISPRPLILIGSGWLETIHTFYASLGEYVPEREHGWLSFVPDNETAVQRLQSIL
ncbi:MAG: uncharacterized protein H6Q38_643 [Chloroflexi bacterium]|nr:uncharacterized protein [Chloroflexota bacterium]